jgi:hypothetical protein
MGANGLLIPIRISKADSSASLRNDKQECCRVSRDCLVKSGIELHGMDGKADNGGEATNKPKQMFQMRKSA